MAKKIEKEKFDWNAFVHGKDGKRIVVHCQTEDEAKQFCKLMHEHGLRWSRSRSYLNITNWDGYRERTYYSGEGTFGDINYANENGDIVLKFSLLDFTEESESKSNISSIRTKAYLNDWDDWWV